MDEKKQENADVEEAVSATQEFVQESMKPAEVPVAAMPEPARPVDEKTDVYTLRTTLGRENVVVDFIESRIKAKHIGVRALLHPPELKGYMFIEGQIEEVQKATQGIPHVRGLLTTPVKMENIEHFLRPKTVTIELNRGDVVEIVGSPFKGEKARVARVDKIKNEVTLELLETGVPIPVTISIGLVKLLEKTTGEV